MTPALLSNADDFKRLAQIHAECFAQNWTAETLADLVSTVGTIGFRNEGGFILVRMAVNEAEILTLAVRPAGRRRGAGTALVRTAANDAFHRGIGEFFLEVATGNAPARGLYTRLGFAEVGRRKAYYALGHGEFEDALILRANLPLSPLGK